MTDIPISTRTQHLKNMIESAESDVGIRVLRSVIKTAAEKADDADVLAMAKGLLQSRIAEDRGNWIRQN